MDEYLNEFINIRESIIEKLDSMIEVYLCDIWDPLMVHTISKELQQLIVRELMYDYSDFPTKYLPRIKFKISTDTGELDTSVQMYLNPDTSLNYLASVELGDIVYDLYCRESWDPSVSHIFYARFGHDYNSFIKGSKVASKEYFMGAMTPLSIAFQLAIDDGYIS